MIYWLVLAPMSPTVPPRPHNPYIATMLCPENRPVKELMPLSETDLKSLLPKKEIILRIPPTDSYQYVFRDEVRVDLVGGWVGHKTLKYDVIGNKIIVDGESPVFVYNGDNRLGLRMNNCLYIRSTESSDTGYGITLVSVASDFDMPNANAKKSPMPLSAGK